jgi:hypothetical protein
MVIGSSFLLSIWLFGESVDFEPPEASSQQLAAHNKKPPDAFKHRAAH